MPINNIYNHLSDYTIVMYYILYVYSGWLEIFLPWNYEVLSCICMCPTIVDENNPNANNTHIYAYINALVNEIIKYMG